MLQQLATCVLANVCFAVLSPLEVHSRDQQLKDNVLPLLYRHSYQSSTTRMSGGSIRYMPSNRYRNPIPFWGRVRYRQRQRRRGIDYRIVSRYRHRTRYQRNFRYSGRSRNRRTGPNQPVAPQYYIELLVVVDYSVYKFWYDTVKSQYSDKDEKKVEAKRRLLNFYGYVVSGINLRFRSLVKDDLLVTVRLAGIHIAETPDASPYTENSKDMNAYPPTVKATSVLTDFRKWLLRTSGLRKHDHAMLFTAYDLIEGTSNARAGQAYLDSMCTDRGVSVVEQQFSALGHTIAAHELAHSLGARHDGDGNNCTKGGNFVMSASTSISTVASRNRKSWLFSHCTAQYLSNYVQRLDRNHVNCMTVARTDTGSSTLPLTDGNYTESVAALSPDRQCQNLEGPHSSLCRSFYEGNYTSLCSLMYCEGSRASACTLRLPLDGTPCGHGKMCQSGQCVPSPHSLSMGVSNSCPFGDQPGTLSSGETCNPLMKFQPFKCYEEYYRTRCCGSCMNLHTGYHACPYGNREQQCSGRSPLSCYTDDVTCCGTCALYRGSVREIFVVGGLALASAVAIILSGIGVVALCRRVSSDQGHATPTESSHIFASSRV